MYAYIFSNVWICKIYFRVCICSICSLCVFVARCVLVCACLGFLCLHLVLAGRGRGVSAVRETLADVSWPLGTQASRIISPSQSGSGAAHVSRSHSCCPPDIHSLFVCLCVSGCVFVNRVCFGAHPLILKLPDQLSWLSLCKTNEFQTVTDKGPSTEHSNLRYAGGSKSQFHTSQSLFTSSSVDCLFLQHGESMACLHIYSASISNRCLHAEP